MFLKYCVFSCQYAWQCNWKCNSGDRIKLPTEHCGIYVNKFTIWKSYKYVCLWFTAIGTCYISLLFYLKFDISTCASGSSLKELYSASLKAMFQLTLANIRLVIRAKLRILESHFVPIFSHINSDHECGINRCDTIAFLKNRICVYLPFCLAIFQSCYILSPFIAMFLRDLFGNHVALFSKQLVVNYQ